MLKIFSHLKRSQYSYIIIVTLLFYAVVLGTDFVGDDGIRITQLKYYLDSGWDSFLMASMPDRPILSLSIYLNYIIFGTSPIYFKLVSLLIHTFNACLVFKILRRMLQKCNRVIEDKYLVVVAILFSLTPINSFAVQSIIQRGVLLSTLFGLLALDYYITYFEVRVRKKLLLASLFILLGVLSKPNALIFIVIIFIILTNVYQARVIFAFKILSPNLIYIAYPIILLKVMGTNADALIKYSPFEYLAYQVEHVFRYVWYYLAPFNLRFIHNYDVDNVFNSVSTYLYAILHFLIVVFAYISRSKKALYSLVILLFYVSLLPESSFLPIIHTFFEHRFYLPSIFLSVGIVFFIAKDIKPISNVLLYCICLYFGVTLINQIHKTRNIYLFEKNNYTYNKTDFNLYSTFLAVTIDYKEYEESLSVLDDWQFDSSYDEVKEIYKGLVNFRNLNDSQRGKMFQATLDYLSKSILKQLDRLHHAKFYLIINKLLFDNYLKNDTNFLKKRQVDSALVPVSAIMCKHPLQYKLIIEEHLKLLNEVLVYYKKNNKLKKVARVYGQLFCYGVVGSKELLKNDKTSDKMISKKYLEYCL